MIAVEFSSKRTSEGHLFVPPAYLDQIPEQNEVRVIVLVEESAENPQPQFEQKSLNGSHKKSLRSLEKLIAKIASKPSDPTTIHAASGLLGEYLLSSVSKSTSSLDWKEWEQAWDRHEAEQKMIERANLVPTDDENLEQLVLTRSPRFQTILERSRKSIKAGKGLSPDEFWQAAKQRQQTIEK